jgi:hypothetical protein
VRGRLIKILSNEIPVLTTEKIESALRQYGYRSPSYRDKVAESDGWPPFVEPFFIWLLEYEQIPRPEQHVKLYFALFPQADNGHRGGLSARIRRAWPSLVRDIHLTALLREAGMTTTYNMAWDREGIDVTVWPPLETRAPLFVHAFVDTKRSQEFRRRKLHGERHFDLPLRREDARIIGNVWLYHRPYHTELVRASL